MMRATTSRPSACVAATAMTVAIALWAVVPAFGAIVDSNGFESPGYTAGDLTGQSGWFTAGSGGGTATVQSAVVKAGAQAVQVDRGANSDDRWAVPVIGFPSKQFVVIEWDMNVLQTLGAPFGPFFGVEAYDDSGGFGLLGSLGVDASTRDVLLQWEDNGVLFETGTKVNFGEWNHYKIELDYGADEYSVFFNNGFLAKTGFVDRGLGLDDFTDADISAIGAAADGASQAATGTAYFDNFVVTQVPEPSSWVLILLGAAMLCWTGRRR